MLIFVAVAVSSNGRGKLFGTYNGFTAKGDQALVDGEVLKENSTMTVTQPLDLTDPANADKVKLPEKTKK